jgi:hypothetical protein
VADKKKAPVPVEDENPKQDIPGVMRTLISFESGHRTLISFESGHYKSIKGRWKGDSVWGHFIKEDGGQIHVNKEKVEYIETFPGND